MSLHQSLLVSLGIIITLCVHAQSEVPQITDTAAILSPSQSSKYLDIVTTKAGKLEQKLDRHSAKALQQMQKLEKRIGGKLAKLDSNKAKEIFGNAEQQYKELEQRLEKSVPLQQYLPSLDSLTSSLKFMEKNEQLFSQTKKARQKLKSAMNKFSGMEGKFQKAEEIKIFLKERKTYLQQALQNSGFAKELKKISKNAYYAAQQVKEYKSMLQDHRKAERKALQLLSKSKLFQNFMRKNSMLASLFRLPGDPNDPVNLTSLAGLQTRIQVNGLIQQQIGPNGQAQFQQNMQDAKSQLQQLKDKVTQLGSNNSDGDMPEGFTVNPEKVKSLLKRLEYSINFQSQKANNFFPASTDLGLSIGYRLSPTKIVGLGMSYRAGLGRGWNHIRFTQESIGFRSFADIKLKGSLWFTSGFEMNYHTSFSSIDQLKDLNKWSRSGLAGLSKVVSLKTKFFKKTKLQLLWDYLSYQQKPRTPPVIFRINYAFK